MIHGKVLSYRNHDEQNSAGQASYGTNTKSLRSFKTHLIEAQGQQVAARKQQEKQKRNRRSKQTGTKQGEEKQW